MKYIILEPTNRISAAKRAELISKELYKIGRPKSDANDVSTGVFDWMAHDGKAALIYDPNYEIIIHKDHDVSILLMLIGEATQKEIAGLEAALNAYPRIPFGHLIPKSAEVREYEWMVENKWINDETTLLQTK